VRLARKRRARGLKLNHPEAVALRSGRLLDNFVAELTSAAYFVAIRHGTADTWLDLELDLWRALADTVKQWGRESQEHKSVPPRPSAARSN
jgi:hypothetical protein